MLITLIKVLWNIGANGLPEIIATNKQMINIVTKVTDEANKIRLHNSIDFLIKCFMSFFFLVLEPRRGIEPLSFLSWLVN